MAGTKLNPHQLPFTYTGNWDAYEYEPNLFYARFLTSGTFTPSKSIEIDVFLVGAGGSGGISTEYATFGVGQQYSHPNITGGGGGGYTTTVLSRALGANISIPVTIGSNSSEATTFSNLVANGGMNAGYIIIDGSAFRTYPGDGGSGGGFGPGKAWGTGKPTAQQGTAGGSDGSDGFIEPTGGYAGIGQGTTTRAFNGDKAIFRAPEFLFSGGGGAGSAGSSGYWGGEGGLGGGGAGGKGSGYSTKVGGDPGVNGAPNTGGGGGGGGGNSTSQYWSAGGKGGSGIVIIRGILNSPPTTPGAITYGQPNAGKILSVTCGTATDPDGDTIQYIWEHRTDSNAFAQIAIMSGTSLSVTVPLNGTTYQVRVKARDSLGNESAYTTGIAKTINRAPFQPADLQYTIPCAGKPVVLTCTASSDPDGDAVQYVWEHRTDSNAFTEIGCSDIETFTTNVPLIGTTYQARVKATDPYGNESAYTTGMAKTINKAPSRPESITYPAPQTGKYLTLSCTSSTDPDGDAFQYIWERSLDGGGYAQIGITNEPGLKLAIDENGTTYQARVKAVDIYRNESAYCTGESISFAIHAADRQLGSLTVGDTVEIPVLAGCQSRFGDKLVFTVAGRNLPGYPANAVMLISGSSGPMIDHTQSGIRSMRNLPASTPVSETPNINGNYELVHGNIYNAAPPAPAYIQHSAPTAGKILFITCGISIDPDDDIVQYVWEHRINQGAFTRIGVTDTNFITHFLPAGGTTYQVRVKAVDSFANESNYTTGEEKEIRYLLDYISVNGTLGGTECIAVSAENVRNFSDPFTVSYDPQKLRLKTMSDRGLANVSTTSGGISFRCDRAVPAGKEYSGHMALFTFEVLQSGETELTLK